MIDFGGADIANPIRGPECKGLFYRYTESIYCNKKGGWTSTRTITMLKRMSCKGCNDCAGVVECMQMEMSEAGTFPVVLPADIQNGDIITPRVVVTGTDWESGYADEWIIEATVVRPA